MFLIVDRRLGMTNYVFTYTDPHSDGFKGDVSENVSLDYDMQAISSWPDGMPRPTPCVGQDPTDPKHYRVFKFQSELEAAGFRFIHPGTPFVVPSWSDYRKLFPSAQDEEERWYEVLDEIDDNWRRRDDTVAKVPVGGSRDEVAAWVAKQHRLVDSGIREVWYLPNAAPPEEIRLLEINDRIAGPEERIEPMDFGVEVGGMAFKLLVADITSKQLEQIKRNPSLLPNGWKLDDRIAWGRRA